MHYNHNYLVVGYLPEMVPHNDLDHVSANNHTIDFAI